MYNLSSRVKLKNMTILGIHDGHNSGATLIKDGKILYSILEERITRVKNEIGYPINSINEIFSLSNLSFNKIDCVAYSTKFMHTKEHLKNMLDWYNVGHEDQLRDKLQVNDYLKTIFDKRRNERIEQIENHLKIDKRKIKFYDHHRCHAAAAYFGSNFNFNEKILVLTADGAGDGLCSTVSIAQNGTIKRIASTDRKASLGKLYSRVTYLLGLKPWEHEYKVMGLAPYGDKERSDSLVKVFDHLLGLDNKNGLEFKIKSDLEINYAYKFLKEKFERARFDEISRAIQLFTEKILIEWVNNCVKETKINKIALGGGVFMNVKANQKIYNLSCVDKLFAFPSCGDESLSFGACWLHHYENSNEQIKIDNIYLGGSFTNEKVKSEIDSFIFSKEISVKKYDNIEAEIAIKLSENNVIARFSGNMEWGARALGNRSILANPADWENIELINSMIKKRDFWMPFAPSILHERHNEYISNPKKIHSPYMMLAFDSKEIARKNLKAAIHPRDKTARAQIVKKSENLKYYNLIRNFEDLTGIPAVLNTSFNLHGYPLVYTPKDAFEVFDKSGLQYLAIEDYLIAKI
tara:strand:+ start:6234 stop:7967 length:1734 start_codon:yes stop_codon:yes gene_type:complete